jgi:regulator of sirC expression with transglutaminase-like and TPR domain
MYQDIPQLGLLEDDDILLDEAALTLALPDHPAADAEPQRALLGAIEAQLLERRSAAANNYDRALLLAAVIAGEFGLSGAAEDYDDPANADLIAVLDRRRGMPIALSIVYVALARRIGWSAFGLNMPGHLLVLIGDPAGGVVIDPFNDGTVLDRDAVAKLRARFDAGSPEHANVAALSNRAMLVRLLLNQATRARAAGQLDRALIVYQRMTAMAPLLSQLWWDRAELEREVGQIAAARASLQAMLETTRDETLRNHIRNALNNLARLVN